MERSNTEAISNEAKHTTTNHRVCDECLPAYLAMMPWKNISYEHRQIHFSGEGRYAIQAWGSEGQRILLAEGSDSPSVQAFYGRNKAIVAFYIPPEPFTDDDPNGDWLVSEWRWFRDDTNRAVEFEVDKLLNEYESEYDAQCSYRTYRDVEVPK